MQRFIDFILEDSANLKCPLEYSVHIDKSINPSRNVFFKITFNEFYSLMFPFSFGSQLGKEFLKQNYFLFSFKFAPLFLCFFFSKCALLKIEQSSKFFFNVK